MVVLSSQQTGVGVMLRNLVGLCVGSRMIIGFVAAPVEAGEANVIKSKARVVGRDVIAMGRAFSVSFAPATSDRFPVAKQTR
jgi:hypothetical protein